MNVFYNYTGSTSCFDIGSGDIPNLGLSGWDYQVAIYTVYLLIHSLTIATCISDEVLVTVD